MSSAPVSAGGLRPEAVERALGAVLGVAALGAGIGSFGTVRASLDGLAERSVGVATVAVVQVALGVVFWWIARSLLTLLPAAGTSLLRLAGYTVSPLPVLVAFVGGFTPILLRTLVLCWSPVLGVDPGSLGLGARVDPLAVVGGLALYAGLRRRAALPRHVSAVVAVCFVAATGLGGAALT